MTYSEIEFVVPMNRIELTMFQIHIRYLLLDTVTGYLSQYHGLSAIGRWHSLLEYNDIENIAAIFL